MKNVCFRLLESKRSKCFWVVTEKRGDFVPNFTRFLTDPQFVPFAEVAVSAEKIYAIDPAACVLNCRRAMAVSYTHLCCSCSLMRFRASGAAMAICS